MIEAVYRNLIEGVTSLKATPSFSTGSFPAIAYKVTPIQGGVVKSDQLEIRIIGNSFDELAEYRDKVIKTLDMEQSKPSLTVDHVVLRSILAGGGWLFNTETQMWELYSIFTTKWRYENGTKR